MTPQRFVLPRAASSAHPPRGVIFRAVACGVMLVLGPWAAPGCNGSSEGDDVLTWCPPAPFRASNPPPSCAFEGKCAYDGPVYERAGDLGGCNGPTCHCEGGRLQCLQNGIACSVAARACPEGIAEGQACTQMPAGSSRPGNGECLFGSGPAGSEATHSCACDLPGPVWRCVPLGSE